MYVYKDLEADCLLTAVAAMLGNWDVACAAAAIALMTKQPVQIM